MQCAAVRTQRGAIRVPEPPLAAGVAGAQAGANGFTLPADGLDLKKFLETLEKELVCEALERTGGNIKRTAEILNYHRPRLYRKMKSFGLRDGADTEAVP